MKKFIFIIIFSVALCRQPLAAFAIGTPYHTRTVDHLGRLTTTRDAYIPVAEYENFSGEELSGPADITFSNDGKMYIADSTAGRVLVADVDGQLLDIIGADILTRPSSVFVSPDGELYVADSGSGSVWLFDAGGQPKHEYVRPQNILFGQSQSFSPMKAVADHAGNVYIISEGNTNGVIQLGHAGDFFGYVGANNTPLLIREIIQRISFTQQQRDQLRQNVPATPINLAIDERGLIYTVTQGGASDGVKKLDIAGNNLLRESFALELLADVCVNPIGNILTVSGDGFIAEYTSDGDLLFIFGGRDTGHNRSGLFVSASGIAHDPAGRVYVLDSEKRSVTVFEPTPYASTVHAALDLQQKGLFHDSRLLWEAALRQDALLAWANAGIADSYFKAQLYREAMQAYRLADARRGYSDSFWEIRNDWMMEYMGLLLLALVMLWLLKKSLALINKKTAVFAPLRRAKEKVTEKRLYRQLAFSAYLPKNPADAFYGIKHEGKVSVASASILYVLFFLVFIFDKYMSGYLYKSVRDGYYEIGLDAAWVFGLLTVLLVGHNLVCSISDGEGRLRDVYCALAYCLTPYIFITPMLTLLSHGLTLNEAFIISFGSFIAVTGSAVLAFVMVMEIQGFSFAKTLRMVLLTGFCAALLFMTGVIIVALTSQLVDFIMSVFWEVYIRA